ncbi:MAG: TonB-dependent receptor [Alphaproteobacteria bacterium]|nr:TonB-dependent receptor [Alphaproteobacteria bacterium]
MRETVKRTQGQKAPGWRKLAGSTCFAALIAAGSVAPAAAAAPERAKVFKGLEEIVVTATKRPVTLQEAGMAVTALSSKTLQDMGVSSFRDFAVRVPNLGFGNATSDGRFAANSPSIRGVAGDNTTGFYIDDVPLPASIMPKVMDIARVEVLRGPQGSLYGARSMGGTIRLITEQPDFEEVSGYVHAKLSTVKEGTANWSIDSTVNLPVIADKLAVRATAYYGHDSGVFDRVYKPTWFNAVTGLNVKNPGPAFKTQKNVDSQSYGGFQLAAKAQIAENLTFTPRIMYQKVKADGMPFADKTPGNFTQARFFNTPEPGTDRWYLASGTLNWDLNFGTIVSTTSYFDRYINEREEEATFLNWLFSAAIGIPINPLVSATNGKPGIQETKSFKSFTQEVRFTSSFDGPFQLTAGLFYQRTKSFRHYPRDIQPGLMNAIDAATGPGFATSTFGVTSENLIFTRSNYFNTKEYAVYGEATYNITDALSLTAGGRYYSTKTDANLSADGFANSGFSQIIGNQGEKGFDPKILLQYQVNDNLNLYINAAKGFRIGGVNGFVPETLCKTDLDKIAGTGIAAHNAFRNKHKTFDSDSLWSYEGGVKSHLLDNRVSLNIAGYYIKWKGIIQQNKLSCGFEFKSNSGSAEIKGLEIELTAAPIEGLTFNAALGYAHAVLTDLGPTPIPGVLVGSPIQDVPNWTASVSGQYIFPLTNSMDGMLRADYNHYGRSFSASNDPVNPRLRPKWNALNLRAGIIYNDWEITLFATNITNTHANLGDSRSIAAETPGRQRLSTNRPRTIGIDVRRNF